MAEAPKNSFYRRPLPSHLVAFSSPEGIITINSIQMQQNFAQYFNLGKSLFREALAKGYLEGYFALSEQFVSQSEPACILFCVQSAILSLSHISLLDLSSLSFIHFAHSTLRVSILWTCYIVYVLKCTFNRPKQVSHFLLILSPTSSFSQAMEGSMALVCRRHVGLLHPT